MKCAAEKGGRGGPWRKRPLFSLGVNGRGATTCARDSRASTEGGHYMRMLLPRLMARVVVPMGVALGVFLIGAPSASADGADVYGVGGGSINLLGGQKAVKF